MSKPYIHALSSAKRYGGKPEDYMDIHNLLDSSKATIPDLRHRALTHNSWFIGTILELIFGSTRVNSAGKVYSIRDIGEQHVLEDYKNKFIPSAQDFLQEIEVKEWMVNGKGVPSSYYKVMKKIKGEKNEQHVRTASELTEGKAEVGEGNSGKIQGNPNVFD